jgi:hypothetical protein
VTDEALVRQWLGQAARQAGLGAAAPDFCDRVLVRLEKGAREYGAENFLQIPLEQLVDEVAEEGDDIGGWGVLAGIRLLAGQELDADVSQEVQTLLLEAVSHGLRAWHACAAARELIT